MQKIGDSTTTANAASEYTEGNPGAGVDATLLKAAWLNTIQRELVAVVAGAGIALDPAQDDQVLSAIKNLFRQGAGAFAADTGAANVYAIACAPAVTALTDGMALRFKAKTANTGASTFSPNGLPAKPLVGLAQAALQGGEIVADGICTVIWSAVLDKWVLISSSGGAVQAANGSRSQHAISMGQLYGSIASISVNTTLTATHRGLVLIDASAGDRTITLPAANTALGIMDVVLRRVDLATSALVIAASGTDKLMLDTSTSAVGQASTELLFAGDYLTLRSDGAGKWWCVGQAQLPGSIASGLVVYGSAGVFSYAVPPVLRSGRIRPTATSVGGGGGGGRSGTAGVPSGGGGGGGESEKLVDLTGIVSVTVTVGAGGLGATTNGATGSTGGSSSFGTYCSASGGLGGYGNSASANAPGDGGMGSGGDVNTTTGPGQPGYGIHGGTGGGAGTRATQGNFPGNAGIGPGGGGSGSASGYTGGSGHDGLVEIRW